MVIFDQLIILERSSGNCFVEPIKKVKVFQVDAYIYMFRSRNITQVTLERRFSKRDSE